jgi:hypothetical protein
MAPTHYTLLAFLPELNTLPCTLLAILLLLLLLPSSAV